MTAEAETASELVERPLCSKAGGCEGIGRAHGRPSDGSRSTRMTRHVESSTALWLHRRKRNSRQVELRSVANSP